VVPVEPVPAQAVSVVIPVKTVPAQAVWVVFPVETLPAQAVWVVIPVEMLPVQAVWVVIPVETLPVQAVWVVIPVEMLPAQAVWVVIPVETLLVQAVSVALHCTQFAAAAAVCAPKHYPQVAPRRGLGKLAIRWRQPPVKMFKREKPQTGRRIPSPCLRIPSRPAGARSMFIRYPVACATG
jgi:hypothetical protein